MRYRVELIDVVVRWLGEMDSIIDLVGMRHAHKDIKHKSSYGTTEECSRKQRASKRGTIDPQYNETNC